MLFVYLSLSVGADFMILSIKYFIEDKSLVNRKRNEMFESREKWVSREGSNSEQTDREYRDGRKGKEGRKFRMDRRLQRSQYVYVVFHVTSLPTPTDLFQNRCSVLRATFLLEKEKKKKYVLYPLRENSHISFALCVRV